ncbi:hypothetical protein [Pseudomonas sp.]|uniref:hypothetical protein n=1 Tax=Pseudomonas sp. TaxID=306 RepID=UPI002B61B8E6|nr:hypothetical protein [Pseudomonas sp.]HUE90666.1 hypothetical protein [Pseudomonas sp.]
MSMQTLWSLFLGQPGQMLNGLALFFGLAGAWLLLATRLREQWAMARLIAGSEMDNMAGPACAFDEPTLRLNRFFSGFGYATLGLALLLSWVSTGL